MEEITAHNLEKYIELSKDDVEKFVHIPNRTMFYLVDMPKVPTDTVKNVQDYKEFFYDNRDFDIVESENCYDFGSQIVYNDYVRFMEEISSEIKELE